MEASDPAGMTWPQVVDDGLSVLFVLGLVFAFVWWLRRPGRDCDHDCD